MPSNEQSSHGAESTGNHPAPADAANVASENDAAELPWYAEGVRFSCRWPQCVACCTGEPGYVWVSPAEAQHLASALSLTVAEFLKRYCREVEGCYSLIELANGDCVFLGEQGCAVYQQRPAQCRTYPFWPEILASRKRWEAEARHCPGINHGERIYSREEIEHELAQSPRGRPRWFSNREPSSAEAEHDAHAADPTSPAGSHNEPEAAQPAPLRPALMKELRVTLARKKQEEASPAASSPAKPTAPSSPNQSAFERKGPEHHEKRS